MSRSVRAPGQDETTLAVDIGATWTRTALFCSDGTVRDRQRRRTPAFGADADPPDAVCELITGLFDAHSAGHTVSRVAISLGAAIDHRTREVLASGPLWGSWSESFNLEERLAAHLPDVDWRVWNDVTALAAHLATTPEFRAMERIAAVTISSGIAERVINPRSHTVDYGVHHGLQGEIGHLPASCTVQDTPLHRACACGGRDHVSSFSSGIALEELSREFLPGCADGVIGFARAAREGDDTALALLDATLDPLVRVLLCQLTVDPALDRIVLTGGVVDLFGDLYLRRLLTLMEDHGLYGVTSRMPNALHRYVTAVRSDDHPCLRGAVTLSGWLAGS